MQSKITFPVVKGAGGVWRNAETGVEILHDSDGWYVKTFHADKGDLIASYGSQADARAAAIKDVEIMRKLIADDEAEAHNIHRVDNMLGTIPVEARVGRVAELIEEAYDACRWSAQRSWRLICKARDLAGKPVAVVAPQLHPVDRADDDVQWDQRHVLRDGGVPAISDTMLQALMHRISVGYELDVSSVTVSMLLSRLRQAELDLAHLRADALRRSAVTR
jgi:hypothetical protein